MSGELWIAALRYKSDGSWLDVPTEAYETFTEARDTGFKRWGKVEEGEVITIYKCFPIIDLVEPNVVTTPVRNVDNSDPSSG